MPTINDVLGYARQYVGKGGSQFRIWYDGHDSVKPWCAMFASYILDATGVEPRFRAEGVLAIRDWAIARNIYVQQPRPGDVAVYQYGNTSHVTFVVEVHADGRLTTLGGNESGGTSTFIVREQVRSAADVKTIDGYVRLSYSDSSTEVPVPAGGMRAISYLETGDGIQHMYSGDENGVLRETVWVAGAPVTSGVIGRFGSPIRSLDSHADPDGRQHVFSGCADGVIRETVWMPGAAVDTGVLTRTGSAVLSLVHHADPDGRQHVFSGAADGVIRETVWVAGAGVSTGNLASIGRAVNSIAYLQEGALNHVFSGAADGAIRETVWVAGAGVSTGNLASIGTAINSIAHHRDPDGRQHVFSGAADGAIRETVWVAGAGVSTGRLL